MTLVFSSIVVVATLAAPAAAAQSHALSSPPTVTASTWHPVTVVDPNIGDGTRDISCVSSTFCISTGFLNVSAGSSVPLIERWDGSSWTLVNTSFVPVFGATLTGVSCVSATFCEAVGYTLANNTGAKDQPLAMTWNGSSWSMQNLPLAAGQISGTFAGVSCVSTTFCMASGGWYNNGSPFKSTAASELWNGSSWQPVTAATVAGEYTYLDRVSCVNPSWCAGVGSVADTATGNGPALLESWNGSSWSLAPATQPAAFAFLDSVSCTGATFCAAVGSTYTESENQIGQNTLTMLWNGSAWSVSPSPNLGGGNGDQLDGVSCFAATSCSAVGFYYTDSSGNYQQNEALTWNGTAWAEVTPANYQIPNTQAGPAAALVGVSCISDWACMANGWAVGPQGDFLWDTIAPIARTGYRFVASDGGVFNYGAGAPFLGSLGGTHLNAPVVGIGIMPAGDGYYLVASDGGVFNYGSAKFYGSMGGTHLNKPIVGMAVTPDGGGYWLVASDGGIFNFGDAQFFGSAGGAPLNMPVVGMASAPNGRGYWLVASDGGIFNYGPAATFLGSTGGTHLNKPIVGIGATSSGQYYLVASDGGIFSFPGGAAGPPFEGSTGAIALNKPIIGMAVVSNGYYLSGSDGGIFSFPSGPAGPAFYGSTGGTALNAPIVGVAS